MFFSRDKEFEEALASPEALEKRLATLRKTRKISCITVIVLIVAFFILFFMGASSMVKHGSPNAAGPVALNATLMLCGALCQAVAALCAHTDIRSLMVYKKALEAGGAQVNPS